MQALDGGSPSYQSPNPRWKNSPSPASKALISLKATQSYTSPQKRGLINKVADKGNLSGRMSKISEEKENSVKTAADWGGRTSETYCSRFSIGNINLEGGSKPFADLPTSSNEESKSAKKAKAQPEDYNFSSCHKNAIIKIQACKLMDSDEMQSERSFEARASFIEPSFNREMDTSRFMPREVIEEALSPLERSSAELIKSKKERCFI